MQTDPVASVRPLALPAFERMQAQLAASVRPLALPAFERMQTQLATSVRPLALPAFERMQTQLAASVRPLALPAFEHMQAQLATSVRPLALPAFERMQAQLAASVRPLALPAFERMQAQLATSVRPLALPAFERMQAQLATSVRPLALPAFERMQAQLGNLLVPDFSRTLQKLHDAATLSFRQAHFPPNLRGIEGLLISDLDAVCMEDGIPLYGLPRQTIAEALIRAPERQERRAILGRRWQAIIDDCEAYVGTSVHPDLSHDRVYAQRAIAALRAGHTEAAQALAANLLDTFVTRHFSAEIAVLKPSKKVKTPDGYEQFVVRKFCALAPIWSAYQRFFPSNGDRVPRTFARHATAHAVTPAQFSRRNAVQATMLVCSLVGYVDERLTGRRP